MIEKIIDSLDKNTKNYVVFDCDDTIIDGDIGQLAYNYILDNDLFKIDFDDILKIAKEKYGILDLNRQNYLEIASKYYHSNGIDLTSLFWIGFNSSEAQNLLIEAMQKTNKVKFKEEFRNLFNLFKENDIEIYICSASLRIFVELIANEYGIKKENVLAIELETIDDKFTGNEIGIITRRQGKVEAIKSLGYNYPPIIIGGDSDGDYAMLTRFNIMHGMIVNPKPNSKVKALVDNRIYFEYK